jgi:methionyl-tRNA synthetase
MRPRHPRSTLTGVTHRDELEEQAREQADLLLEHLVQRSEQVEFRQGTYLLAALAAELGGIVQRRCWELAKEGEPTWEMAASEAETLINAAWRCMASIDGVIEQDLRRIREREARLERERQQRGEDHDSGG